MKSIRANVCAPLGLPVVLAVAALFAGCTSTVNRAAFWPDRSYTFPDAHLPAHVRHAFIPTADGEQLEAYHVARADATKLVVFFHGNTGNIAQRLPQLLRVAATARVNVLGIGYRGYGASTGEPSERGIYRDGEAALRHATRELGFAENQIVLCGVSLGTAVAVQTAVDRDLAGLILITPMTSARALAYDHDRGSIAWLAGGAFDSLAKVARLRAPVLVIHGTFDEVIPFAQGRRLFEAIPTPKQFVAIPGARHNNVAWVDEKRFWSAIADFVTRPPGGEVSSANSPPVASGP